MLAVRVEVRGGARPPATDSIPPNGLSCRPQARVTEGFAEHPSEDSLPTWRVCNEANTRGVPRSGEGFLVTLGQTEQQHGGRSFSSRVLSALAQIQRRCQVKKQWWNRFLQWKRGDSKTRPSSIVQAGQVRPFIGRSLGGRGRPQSRGRHSE